MSETWLYIYRNDELRQVYVGIGSSAARIWDKARNDDALQLLEHPATGVFVTSERFPDRQSAERAESAAIFAAAAAGAKVFGDREDLKSLTNIAKVQSSKHIVPDVFRRSGEVSYLGLTKTAIVTISLDSIDDDDPDGDRRPALHAGRSQEDFRLRSTRYHPLGAADARRRENRLPDGTLPRDVTRLIARQVQTGVILGAWDLHDDQWKKDSTGSKWIFITLKEASAETGEMRGKLLDMNGEPAGRNLYWSKDIRDSIRQ